MTDLLFIYGSLLQDNENEYALYLKERSELVGPATILGKLYEISWYPGVIPTDDTKNVVHGQVVRLTGDMTTTLEKLDEYEGYYEDNLDASEFVRKRVRVSLNSQTTESWVYFFNQPTIGMYQIESGDYLSYIENKK
ncbi:gamma-glutamylcyclotransferase family protein [Reichenbachiella versicolor]|uniref:gamma-glutamylcyclotransferase family protein n=1 Tax=Reichenbachiella versicolor TaxID=1821036 RepID=UPI000D6E0EC8|nr:gamma-glutamylcyclotransferase family protein [Reichenbachiella versicolor]